jgi:hypothetical protein
MTVLASFARRLHMIRPMKFKGLIPLTALLFAADAVGQATGLTTEHRGTGLAKTNIFAFSFR